MKRLLTTLESVLHEPIPAEDDTDYESGVPAGAGGSGLHSLAGLTPPLVDPDVTRRERLVQELGVLQRRSNPLLWIAVITHVSLLVAAYLLLFYFRRQPGVMATLSGGSIVALLAIARGLSSLWKERVLLGVLVATIPQLTAGDAVKLAQTVYSQGRPNGG
jgi:hypothetical protein